jgi:hypothetical protein
MRCPLLHGSDRTGPARTTRSSHTARRPVPSARPGRRRRRRGPPARRDRPQIRRAGARGPGGPPSRTGGGSAGPDKERRPRRRGCGRARPALRKSGTPIAAPCLPDAAGRLPRRHALVDREQRPKGRGGVDQDHPHPSGMVGTRTTMATHVATPCHHLRQHTAQEGQRGPTTASAYSNGAIAPTRLRPATDSWAAGPWSASAGPPEAHRPVRRLGKSSQTRRQHGCGEGPRGSGGLLEGRIARRRRRAAPLGPPRGASAGFGPRQSVEQRTGISAGASAGAFPVVSPRGRPRRVTGRGAAGARPVRAGMQVAHPRTW